MAERTQKWDILKFFLMFTVVLGHFCDYHTETSAFARGAFLFIYSFHMPLFIFVSGLFAKRTVNERRWDKIVGYLVLYFATKVLVFVYNTVFKGEPNFRLFGETGLAWFMFALFAFALITIAASRYKPKFVLPVALVLSLLAGYDEGIDSEMVLSRIIVFFPFYYAGYLLDAKKLEEISRDKRLKIAAAAVLVVFGVVAFAVPGAYHVRPMFTGQHPYDSLGGGENFGFLIRLACYAVSALICAALIILTPDKMGKGLIAKKGQYTLPVYMFHYIATMLLYNVLNAREFFSGFWTQLLLIPLSLAVTLVFANGKLNSVVQFLFSLPERARLQQEKPQDIYITK